MNQGCVRCVLFLFVSIQSTHNVHVYRIHTRPMSTSVCWVGVLLINQLACLSRDSWALDIQPCIHIYLCTPWQNNSSHYTFDTRAHTLAVLVGRWMNMQSCMWGCPWRVCVFVCVVWRGGDICLGAPRLRASQGGGSRPPVQTSFHIHLCQADTVCVCVCVFRARMIPTHSSTDWTYDGLTNRTLIMQAVEEEEGTERID